MDVAVRTEGIPVLDLWDYLTKRKNVIAFMEDNEASAQIIKTGKCPTLRHMNRTHNVDVAWLHDRFKAKDMIVVELCPTRLMAADIFTKGFTEVNKWVRACQLIGHVDPEVIWGKTWKTLPCAAAPIAHADHRISVQESIFEHFWRYAAHLPGAKDTAGKLKVFTKIL